MTIYKYDLEFLLYLFYAQLKLFISLQYEK